MQLQADSNLVASDLQVNNISEIAVEERMQYALKMTEFMSRWKKAKSLNLTKWKNNIITKLTPANLQKFSSDRLSLCESLNQLLVQLIYLIYSCAMNKVNLQISTNIYISQNLTLLGTYFLPQLNLSATYQQLKRVQKGLSFTFEQFQDMFESNEFAHLCENINQLKVKYKKSVPKLIFQNQHEFLFFNFGFRTVIAEDDLKRIVLYSLEALLNQLGLGKRGLESEGKQLLGGQQAVWQIFGQNQTKLMYGAFINELEVFPAAWSDREMRYLEGIERQVDFMRLHSFTAKFKTCTLQGMLLSDESKVKGLASAIYKERNFYQEMLVKHSASNVQSISSQTEGMNMHASEGMNMYASSVVLSLTQQHMDFNHINYKGGFVIQDTFFKPVNFIKNPNTHLPEHIVLQQIQTIKRSILLQKTGQLIEVMKGLVQMEESEHCCGMYLEHQYFSGLGEKAQGLKVREVDVLNQEVARRLYMAEMAHFQTLRQIKGDDHRLAQIVDCANDYLSIQIPAFRLQLPLSTQEQPRSKSQTIPQGKSESQTKCRYIQVVWIVKYLRNFMLEKELFKCEVSRSLLVYLVEVRLVCVQRVREEAYKHLEEAIVKLRDEHWANGTGVGEALSTKLVKDKDEYRLVLKISFSEHNLNQFIWPLICSIGHLLTYYFELSRVLRSIEVQSTGGENQLGDWKEEERVYQEELEVLKERVPHHLELVRSLQFVAKEKIDEYL